MGSVRARGSERDIKVVSEESLGEGKFYTFGDVVYSYEKKQYAKLSLIHI